MYSSLQPIPFSQATGKVAYNMTNDALFHIVLQENEKALIGLIASLLHLDPSEICNAEVLNPIKYGHLLQDKTYVLDILVKFNNGSRINLEMQIEDLKNWVPRSLSYLCREFEQLDHGDDYDKINPVYHVGFLDYTLFPGHPEFYATYRMCNVKNGHEYSDKLTLSVVELNHIDMATDEDKAYNIDTWAALFKATTWEEIKMLAQKDPYIESAAESIYSSVTDPEILKLCKKRQEDIRGDIRRRERLIELDKQISQKDKQLAEQNKQIVKQNKQISQKDEQLAEQDKQLTDQSNRISRLESILKSKGIEVPD